MRGQPRHMSLAESLVNVGIGYVIALITTAVVLPLFGFDVSIHQSAAISGVFTVVSIARSYLLRRAFNWWHYRRNP